MAWNSYPSPLSRVLERADQLPSMPGLAATIVRLTQDEETTVELLSETLALDPSLSAKLLKASNSASYGVAHKVSTLTRATTVMGFNTVKFMSLGFLLTGDVGREAFGPLCREQFWRRCLVRAIAARRIAEALPGLYDEEAHLCGLLARVGQAALSQALPEEYREVLALCGERWPDPELERRVLGASGAEAGLALLRSWDLPDTLALGALLADKTLGEPDPRAPAELILALRVAAAAEETLCGPDPVRAHARLEHTLREAPALAGVDVEDLLLRVEDEVAEAASLYDLPAGGPVDVHTLLERIGAGIVRLGTGLDTELRDVRKQLRDTEDRNQELDHDAHTDHLTQLPNRALFEQRLDACTARCERLAVLMVDIDHFKRFNDTHGHHVGDEVLREVARAIAEAAREGDLAARYGGEEFAVVLPGSLSLTQVEGVAERIRSAVEARGVVHGDQTLHVTVSVGGALSTEIVDAERARRLVRQADRYLYEAKDSGRNCSVVRAWAVPGHEPG